MNSRTLNPGFFTALWFLPCLAVLQAGLMSHLAVAGALPDIVLIVVVDWGILRGMDEGVLWAFMGGLLLDFFSGYPLGTNTVSLALVASLVSLGQGTFIRTHALLPLATVALATLLYYGCVLFILESTQHQVAWISIVRDDALPAAIFNGALNIAIFPLMRRLEERVYPIPRAHW